MRQRVMIALAMACDPTLLIADEPTTALDVTIQAQILTLMRRLQAQTGMSILLITHNLGVVAHHADDVAVMYSGRIVEAAPVRPLFAAPQHPYTRGLLDCLPGKSHAAGQPRPARLFAIRGAGVEPAGTAAGLCRSSRAATTPWRTAATRCRRWWTPPRSDRPAACSCRQPGTHEHARHRPARRRVA
jgi:peptide/nickel transport system ATP-binding protein